MQLQQLLPKRRSDAHKYDFGHVLVIGGSVGMSGAVVLASSAALRSGCGMVSSAVPHDIVDILENNVVEAITVPLASDGGMLHSSALSDVDNYIEKRKVDVIAIGCGMRCNEATSFILKQLVKYSICPLVIDADGLNAIALDNSILNKVKTPVVLTPHLGEFARLTGQSIEYIKKNTKKLAKEYALMYNVCLVVKGQHTFVTDGDSSFENFTGNSGMATAGSGDVLTGIISGLIAQGLASFDACKLAVYLHGLSADKAAEVLTEYCLNASDIIRFLPAAIKLQ